MQNEPRRQGAQDRGGFSELDFNRKLLSIAVLGFLLGIVFSLFIGTGLWAFGLVNFGAGDCPQAKDICPPTPAFMPACPTCAVEFVTMPPPTATATATPDLAATATAACAAFQDDFPGTPCPSPQATATP